MKSWRLIVVVFALTAASWCADYQVVIKSSGRVLHGEYLTEDATTITVNINNAEVTFKKEKLDLDRMRELNKPRSPSDTARPADSPEDKYQTIVADEIKHWENSLGAANRLLADCHAGKIKCTANDYKLANGQVEESQRTLRELKLEHGTYENAEEQALRNRHKELSLQMTAAQNALLKAERDKASPEVIEARRKEILRLADEFDKVERTMMQHKN